MVVFSASGPLTRRIAPRNAVESLEAAAEAAKGVERSREAQPIRGRPPDFGAEVMLL